MAYNIIDRGVFNCCRAEGVQPSQYLLAERDGQRLLLLRFFNNTDERITGITLRIFQKDAYGKSIGFMTVDCSVCVEPRSMFILNKEIILDETCESFDIKVISSHIGDYSILNDSEDFKQIYQKHKYKETAQIKLEKSRIITERKFKTSLFVCFAMVLMMLVSVFAIYAQISIFKSSNDTFFYEGVEYAFEGNNKSESSNIYVVGSKLNVKNIVIYDKIKNHKVTHISDTAFNGDTTIERLTIKASIDIKSNTFALSSLTYVLLENVKEIGNQAFSRCKQLTEFYATDLSYIGFRAFENCSNLESVSLSGKTSILRIEPDSFSSCLNLSRVDIDQYIDFGHNSILFPSLHSVKNLRLKNFNYAFDFGGIRYEQFAKPIFSIFGLNRNYASNLSLEELTIDNIDTIPSEFCYNLPLTSLNIRNLTNREIGSYAFFACTKLKDLTINLPIISVGAFAFYSTAIEEFEGQSLSYIGNQAFSNCTNLTSINLSDLVSFLGEGAFSGCQSLYSIYISKQISTIKERTFYDCLNLTDVSIGAKLTRIEDEAFYNCQSLSDSPIFNSLITIGEYAFFNCSFEAISLPSTITSIGYGAFSDCINLKEIEVPFIGHSRDSDRYMSYIFASIQSVPKTLEKIIVQSVPYIYPDSFSGFAFVKEIIINSDYDGIGSRAFFNCKNLDKFIISKNVSFINDNAFENCYKLFELFNLSNLSIEPLSKDNGMAGYYAIKIYSSLLGQRIPRVIQDNYEFICDDNQNWHMINYLSNEKQPNLPLNIYYNSYAYPYQIARFMFAENDDITRVIISQNVTKIGKGAFLNCPNLTYVYISKEVGLIEDGILMGTPIVDLTLPFLGENVHLNYGATLNHTFSFKDSPDYNSVPNTLEIVTLLYAWQVADSAFYGCESIKEINILSDCISIGQQAFYLCKSLERIVLPDSLKTIGNYAFYNCNKLTEIDIPDGVTFIGTAVFMYCNSLSKISVPFAGGSQYQNRHFSYLFGGGIYESDIIPSTLQEVTITIDTIIDEFAFYNMYQLKTVNLNSVEVINNSAFIYCSSLTNVNFSDSLRVIGECAFTDCYNLESITLPASLQSITQNAFYYCYRLHEVYNLSPLDIKAGNLSYGQVALYAIAVYTSLSQEPLKKDVIEGIEYKHNEDIWAITGYTQTSQKVVLQAFEYKGEAVNSFRIAHSAFMGNHDIRELVITSAVTSIDKNGFRFCTNLTSVRFENSQLTMLEDGVFSDCPLLMSVELPNSLNSIGEDTFFNCYSLTSIIIPKNVSSIGNNAFLNCYALKDVVNLSYLNVVKGNNSNGSLALYALRVSVSLVESLPTVIIDSLVFIKFGGVWYLVAIREYQSEIRLPKSFNYNSEWITSYIVQEGAFVDKHINSLFVPMAVSAFEFLENVDCFDIAVIYYQGTSTQWSRLLVTSSINNATVYYNVNWM